MAILDRVMEMRRQGYTDSQVIDTLREMGVSPKEINDSLSQSRIKSEVTRGNQNFNQQQDSQFNQMQPSIMKENERTDSGIPEPQNYSKQQGYYEPSASQYEQNTPSRGQGQEQQYAEQPQYYDPNNQSQYPEYRPSQSIDVETINDISEQIVEEKTNQMKKEISSLSNFKEEINNQIELLNRRLEKMENNFSELQLAILRKIGEYGEDIKNVTKELQATQDSFSKIINPLMDRREIKELNINRPKKEEKRTTKERSNIKEKSDFEDYLR